MRTGSNVEPPSDIDALIKGQQQLRITEVLPNPVEPGIDTAYEWVEITNTGAVPVSTEGMTIGDNSGSTPLHTTVLAPGASLVIAAPQADAGAAPVVQRAPAIGNGLSNSGDRLVLLAADGSIVDALSYGTDRTYAGNEPIAAPREGQSIERSFDADGVLVAVTYLDAPTPGYALVSPRGGSTPTPEDEVAPGEGDGAPVAVAGAAPATGRPVEADVWILLLLVAGGALGGAVLYRVTSIARERDGAAE